ncbi:MAG: ABC transporter ATP-binding protein [Candidatus Rokubacteria bacterium]|nr:ABC transporter ATP-binding protein [Candidatus Rokubacteria bacterium]
MSDVTLTIDAGEFLTLLGPSGSGKTTTLMMVAGFVPPTSGEIYIDGQPVTKIPPQRRNLSMVFQSYALFPHMTVERNIAFPLEVRRTTRTVIRERVREALEMVQLAGYEQRRPHELSGGQQQRVALARALAFEPRALLMDEPLGALDKKLRQHMQLEIKRIQRSLGLAVIYVTHDQEEALTMSDRIAIMNEGRIEQVGPPEELYDRPINRFVADFVGESNFLEGTVRGVGEDGLVTLEHPSGQIVQAFRDGPVQRGTKVIAAIRPERISLTDAPGLDGPDGWRGQISDIIYGGDFTKYKVDVGGQYLIVKVQNHDDGHARAVGDIACISWAPLHLKILDG